jgi:hypothetical protein
MQNIQASSSKRLELIEPDFVLLLNPKKDLAKDARYAYAAPRSRYGMEDIDVEWKIVFRDGELTDHY